MHKAVAELRNQFLEEGRAAPMLFRDLAKLETYIAESYKTRSLIELIQNADDAEAERLGVHDTNNGFAIGNTGRAFTVNDLKALCRSGASQKSRGSSTIGYRGIGFKSVVNLAKTILVYSGDYEFCFDKELSIAALGQAIDVPLVRIPHPIQQDTHNDVSPIIQSLRREHGYTTIFIFANLNERLSNEELADFDAGSLLFLNHVRSLSLHYGNIHRDIAVDISRDADQRHLNLSVCEGKEKDRWTVFISQKDPTSRIAARTSPTGIIPASQEESVFHSFTPSEDFTGALLKVNGDYTTDPSRKRIDMDERSKESFDNAVELLADLILEIIAGNQVIPGFFAPLVDGKGVSPGHHGHSLIKGLSPRLTLWTAGEQGSTLVNYRLRPEWMNYDDYEKICRGDLVAIRRELIGMYPELPDFLERIGVPALSLVEVVDRVNHSSLSTLGLAQLVTRLIKQYRYDLSEERLSHFRTLNAWPTGQGILPARNIASDESLETQFLQFISDHVDSSDLKLFLAKIGLKHVLTQLDAQQPVLSNSPGSQLLGSSKNSQERPSTASLPAGMKAKPQIQQWRSAEQNAEEYLRALNGVTAVTDMSRGNLGYDLEVVLESGQRIYVEVKSVKSFSEPFRLTNNEYTCAHQYKSAYAIAIVFNSQPFQLSLIFNPIETLILHKQCERWSWRCEEYQALLTPPSSMLNFSQNS